MSFVTKRYLRIGFKEVFGIWGGVWDEEGRNGAQSLRFTLRDFASDSTVINNQSRRLNHLDWETGLYKIGKARVVNN